MQATLKNEVMLTLGPKYAAEVLEEDELLDLGRQWVGAFSFVVFSDGAPISKVDTMAEI